MDWDYGHLQETSDIPGEYQSTVCTGFIQEEIINTYCQIVSGNYDATEFSGFIKEEILDSDDQLVENCDINEFSGFIKVESNDCSDGLNNGNCDSKELSGFVKEEILQSDDCLINGNDDTEAFSGFVKEEILENEEQPVNEPYDATSPDNYQCPDGLTIRKSGLPNAGQGVWSLKAIPKGVQFGPLKDVKPDIGVSPASNFGNPVDQFEDGEVILSSNWMQHVKSVDDAVKGNLLAFQEDGETYYKTVKLIKPNEELLVRHEDVPVEQLSTSNHVIKQPQGNTPNAAGCKRTPVKILKVRIAKGSKSCFCSKCGKAIPAASEAHVTVGAYTDKGAPKSMAFICVACLKELQPKTKQEDQIAVTPKPEPPEKTCPIVDKALPKKSGIEIKDVSPNVINIAPLQAETACTSQTSDTRFVGEVSGVRIVRLAEKELHRLRHLTVLKVAISRDHTYSKSSYLPYRHQKVPFLPTKYASKTQTRYVQSPANSGTKTETSSQSCVARKSTDDNAGRNKDRNMHSEVAQPPSAMERLISQIPTNFTVNQEASPTEMAYTCNFCGKGFSMLANLTIHMSRHNVRGFDCTVCGKKFDREDGLTTHMRVHKAGKTLVCQICRKSFGRQELLDEHVKTHVRMKASAGVITYKFKVCDEPGHTKPCLKKHTAEDERPHMCDVCGKRFREESNMTLHMKTHPETTTYSCKDCDKKFITKLDLTQHMAAHRSQSPMLPSGSVACDVCGKGFSRPDYLRTHMRVHSGERPFSCVVCGSAFTQQSNLVKHMQKHSDDRPYCCEICGKTFKLQQEVPRHMKTHSKTKPHVCTVCGASFKRVDQLKRHLKIHSCTICGEGFTQNSELMAHMRTHRGET